MLTEPERIEIRRLWDRRRQHDAQNLPQAQRHRNLWPVSAEFLSALAAGAGVKRILEVGGSSGLSTIALAAAARETGGKVVTIELEPTRQAEARQTMVRLGLEAYVEFHQGDAGAILPTLGEFDFVFIDCEKDDYIRFFDLLHLAPGALVVADNVISHSLTEYSAHVRQRPGTESITLPVGEGLEVTRMA